MIKKVKIILPQEEVTRKEPVYGFSQKDLFSHEMHKIIPETRMLRLKECQVFANGFLVDRFSLLPRPETFWHPPVGFEGKKEAIKRVLKELMSSKKKVLLEPALVLTDCASGCYFHWIADVLQKCEALEQVKGSDFLRSITLVVPAMANHPWVKPSLEPFSFKAVKVLEKKERVFCQDLSFLLPVAPTGHYRPAIMQSLRERFRNHFGYRALAGRFFISRQKASCRKIVNEERLLPVLQRNGFQVVVLEDLSFNDQIKLIGGGEMIAGLHGSGLVNMTWMAPRTKVLEIRLQDDSHNNCYFSLASTCNLLYYFVLADEVLAQKSGDEVNIYGVDVKLDPLVLEKALVAMGCRSEV